MQFTGMRFNTQACTFSAGDTGRPEERLEEMRALLAQRREHLPLWHAYGQQLYKAGQAKVMLPSLHTGF